MAEPSPMKKLVENETVKPPKKTKYLRLGYNPNPRTKAGVKKLDTKKKAAKSECPGGTLPCGLCTGLAMESCPAQEVCDRKLCPDALSIPCCVNCACEEEKQRFMAIDCSH